MRFGPMSLQDGPGDGARCARQAAGAAHGRYSVSRTGAGGLWPSDSLCFRLREGVMGFDYTLCLIAGFIVLIYLGAALLRPEKF